MNQDSYPKGEKCVAVVVLNWNGIELLRQFIPNWLAHTPDYAELIIVDNGSTDGSADWLREQYPQVKCLAFSENYGFAEGYNRAIEVLDYPYIVLLNSDVELSEGWLSPLVELLRTCPEVLAVQPKIGDYKAKTKFEYAGAAGGYLDALGYPYCAGRLFDTCEEDKGQYDQGGELMWASGACLMLRREAYRSVGGLDPRFFAHQEEIDLCWRLRSIGGEIRCAGESKVYHIGGASLDALNPRKTYLNFRNNLLMLYKNMPTRRLLSVLSLRLGLDALATLRFMLSGQSEQAKAVCKAWRDFVKMRSDFKQSRAENLRRQSVATAEILSSYSIVWQYYVLGRKTFKELK